MCLLYESKTREDEDRQNKWEYNIMKPANDKW